MSDVFDVYNNMVIDRNDTYIRSYPALLAGLQPMAAQRDPYALIVMAHAVYGWMPTILGIYGNNDRIAVATDLGLPGLPFSAQGNKP